MHKKLSEKLLRIHIGLINYTNWNNDEKYF